MILKGEVELNVDDPAYAMELADHRKWEITNILTKRLTGGIIARQEYEKKMKIL